MLQATTNVVAKVAQTCEVTAKSLRSEHLTRRYFPGISGSWCDSPTCSCVAPALKHRGVGGGTYVSLCVCGETRHIFLWAYGCDLARITSGFPRVSSLACDTFLVDTKGDQYSDCPPRRPPPSVAMRFSAATCFDYVAHADILR